MIRELFSWFYLLFSVVQCNNLFKPNNFLISNVDDAFLLLFVSFVIFEPSLCGPT